MITKIRDNLFLSGIGEVNQENLSSLGITAIVNVSCHENDPFYDGCKQVQISLKDSNENHPALKELAVYAVKSLLMNGDRVLVHCFAGASRSVWVVSKVLSDLENRHIREVCEEVISLRPGAFYGPLFENN